MSFPLEQLSLLRTEARERARNLRVTQMLVELDLTLGESIFASKTTLMFDSASRHDTFVDFKGRELRSVMLNGAPVDRAGWSRGRIGLTGLQQHNTLVVDGLMAYSTDGEGLHRHIDPADSQTYLYAMSFLDAAPRWFACFDQPDLKAPYELRVTAPLGWTVVGNGPSHPIGSGVWQVKPPRPLSTYFVTLVAGPYASVLTKHDGVPLGLHVRASLKHELEAEAADLFAVTKASLDYFHRVFGIRYPFGEYHQAFVPDSNAGAMENPGCVTVRDQYIFRGKATTTERAHRAGTVAHEMAHMWFGDLVTMTWWDDLWLNESFAEYMAHRACAEATPYDLWTEFGIVRKDWGSVADQAPSTHPVAASASADANSALQDFDGISYAKGAAVLKQLVAYLGDEAFFDGLRRYFTAHAFGNADFADLIASWSSVGSVDLGAWATAWLKTSGLDTIDVVRDHGTAVITSTPPAGQPVIRTHALKVGAFDQQGRPVARTAVRLAGQSLGIELPDGVALLVPDVEDDTWAKIRFGAGGWQHVAEVLGKIVDPTPRVVIYNSIRDAVRNAELDPSSALDLICVTIVRETSDVVLTSMLQFAQDQLAGPYATPDARRGRRLRVQTTARAILEDSVAGSDRQLAAFRIVIRSCDDVGLLHNWLTATRLPDGIVLDPELVWAIVGRLSPLTGDAHLIDAALRDDSSAAAAAHAARARARLPRADAKEAAWRLLTEPTSASAYELYATAEGFFAPEQSELTHPYVSRYFTEIPLTSALRQGWALGRVALLAFPGPAATEETLALAEESLARVDLATPVRRSLVDGTDGLRRAVVALRVARLQEDGQM
jgi:aminopeptidase N